MKRCACRGCRQAASPAQQAAVMTSTIDTLRAEGAVVTDSADIPSIVTSRLANNALNWTPCVAARETPGNDAQCSIVLKYGMKRDFNASLRTLGGAAPVSLLRSLREWNRQPAGAGALRYGQSALDISDDIDLEGDRARYEEDRKRDLELGGGAGIDAAIEQHDLDALRFPGASGLWVAAKAGYPPVMVPVGTIPPAPLPSGGDGGRAPLGELHCRGVHRAAAPRACVRVRARHAASRAAPARSVTSIHYRSIHMFDRLSPLIVLLVLSTSGAACSRGEGSQPSSSAGHTHYAETPEASEPSPTGALAPRLQNLGSHTFPVSTKNADAQAFMNQGLNLAYAFNHAEARRAFREAARLDPDLAMAYWGQGLVLGPNINAAMDSNEEPAALELVQKAVSLKDKASPREQAYIDALAKRYSGTPEHRVVNDKAYAMAMRDVHRAYPDDLDAAMLYVEAMMDLRPWGYWMRDGSPHEGTAEIVALTEQVMQKHPTHPGALHMYIHLMEATAPERAEQAADKLLPLMPAAGHMVHMPAHIYQRVGRYADAVRSNELAIAADEDYITQCRAQGLYPMAYYPHNIHFLWFAATFDGRGALAIESARKIADKISDATLKEVPITQAFRVVPYYALTRFGRWDEMLAEPAPPAGFAFLQGIWHYARGISYVAKKQLPAAEQELGELREVLKDKSLEQPLFSPNSGLAVLSIAPAMLAGQIAAARKDYEVAVSHLDKAVRLEDALVYTEPAEWHYPPRQALAAVLLEAGRAVEAESVYWEDLRRNRDNGWSLFGQVQALKAQQKTEEAALVEARFKKAWARADVTPVSSMVALVASSKPTAAAARP
jgi:tetratricopeptide (TPR) repeat protein